MRSVIFFMLVLILTACGGGGSGRDSVSGGQPAAQTYSLGASVRGLGSATGLIVQSGNEYLTLPAGSNSFTFARQLNSGAAYSVTIQSQPLGYVCNIANGIGTIGGASVTNVLISCSSVAYSLGGTLSGLTTAGLVLGNSTNTVGIPSGAKNFLFPSQILSGTSFNVSVQTQPVGLTCSVSNGLGTIAYANNSDVSISCAANAHTLGGVISGLVGSGLQLASGGQTLALSSGANSFVLPQSIPESSIYSVVVQAQPSGLLCTVVNGSGVIGSSNVTSVSVNCAPPMIATVSTFAGRGDLVGGLANGSGTAARFNYAAYAAVDGSGNIYVTELNNGDIRKITPSGFVTTFAAGFSAPRGIAVDGFGNVFVVDQGVRQIKKIDSNGIVSNFSGTGADGYLDGPKNVAVFGYPMGIAVDQSGNVFVSEVSVPFNGIRKITPNGDVTTFAGSGTQGFVNASGPLAKFNGPTGLAIDVAGNLYVADTGNNAIRKIDTSGTATTIAGSGVGLYRDGTGVAASFWNPWGVAVDSGGNLFVSDSFNSVIRKILPDGQVLTFAGNRIAGYLDGLATTAEFNLPMGIAVDGSGNVFVVEQTAIRKIVP